MNEESVVSEAQTNNKKCPTSLNEFLIEEFSSRNEIDEIAEICTKMYSGNY